MYFIIFEKLSFKDEKDAKERKPVLDDAGCEIYMGNYNKKIPPSINYWYLNDGKNMSQKILYYRSLHPEVGGFHLMVVVVDAFGNFLKK